MLELVAKALLLVTVAAALVWAFQPRYLFVIRIVDGRGRLTNGKATSAFVADAAEACADFNVRNAWLGGVKRGGRVTLAFSRTIPPPCRQRLRNLWLAEG